MSTSNSDGGDMTFNFDTPSTPDKPKPARYDSFWTRTLRVFEGARVQLRWKNGRRMTGVIVPSKHYPQIRTDDGQVKDIDFADLLECTEAVQ